MKKWLIILFIIGFSVAKAQKNIPLIYDTSKIVIMPLSKIQYYPDTSKKVNAILTQQEINEVEHILVKAIKYHNCLAKKYKDNNEIIILSKYRRQYFAYINTKREKEVYINCFCADDIFQKNWKNTYVDMFDGGICSFRITINLSHHKYYGFSHNGDA